MLETHGRRLRRDNRELCLSTHGTLQGPVLIFEVNMCDDYRVSMALEELEHENPQDRASDR